MSLDHIAITRYLLVLQLCTISRQIMLVAISEPSPVPKAETSFCQPPPPRKRRESRRVQCVETSPQPDQQADTGITPYGIILHTHWLYLFLIFPSPRTPIPAMAPPRQRTAAVVDDSRSEASSGTREHKSAAPKRKTAGTAKEKVSITSAPAIHDQQADEQPRVCTRSELGEGAFRQRHKLPRTYLANAIQI